MSHVNENLTNLARDIAEKQDFEYYDVEIKEISSEGANYSSKLYNITITEGNKVLKLFAKVAAIGDQIRENAPRIYETESFAYNKLAKLYEQLQEDYNIPEEDKLHFPKLYGNNPKEFEETLVLEDLVAAGYGSYNRFEPITWEYACTALKELTKMHALAFAYQQKYPEEFAEIVEKLKFPWDIENEHLRAYVDLVIKRALPNVCEENRDKVMRFFEGRSLADLNKYQKEFRRPVLGHWDYRPSNLMHRTLDDGKLEIKIVDLQTLQASSPVIDLLYFIFTGSDEQFRAEYFDKLVDYYYTQLCEAMRRLQLDPEEVYSKEDFDFELKEKLPFGLNIAIFTLPIITVEAENAPKVNKEMDFSSFSVENTSELYVERLNGVINDYVKWGVLK